MSPLDDKRYKDKRFLYKTATVAASDRDFFAQGTIVSVQVHDTSNPFRYVFLCSRGSSSELISEGFLTDFKL